MSRIFSDRRGLRTQYFEANHAQISAATSVANAHYLCAVGPSSRIAIFQNQYSCDVQVYLVHPDVDNEVSANRLMFIELEAKTAINFSSDLTGLELDPQTKIYLVKGAGSSAAGEKFRLFMWG